MFVLQQHRGKNKDRRESPSLALALLALTAVLISASPSLSAAAAAANADDAAEGGDAVKLVELDADNFEHLTQASSGATTGDWLVYFDTSGEQRVLEVLRAAAPALRERNVVAAHVNCFHPKNDFFCDYRFGVFRHPAGDTEKVSLVSKGAVYELSGLFVNFPTLREDTLFDFLDHHTDNDWRIKNHIQSGPVPPTLKPWDPWLHYVRLEWALWPRVQSHRMTALSLFAVAGVVFGVVFGLVISRCLCPSIAAPTTRPERSLKSDKKER